MRKTTFAAAALAAFIGVPALQAQSGPALKASYVFNQSKVDDARSSGFDDVPSPDGFSVGAEFVLPMGIGIGATAYTEGKATDVNTRSSSFAVWRCPASAKALYPGGGTEPNSAWKARLLSTHCPSTRKI